MTNNKILFCKIKWLEEYEGYGFNEGCGEEYLEIYNFYDYYGDTYGFIDLSKDKYIDIKKIDGSTGSSVESVLVIWTATDPIDEKLKVVGWYNNAIVYRNPQIYYNDLEDEKLYYSINAKSEDAYFLEESNRVFEVPYVGTHISGFGDSNIWYANGVKSEEMNFEEKFKNRTLKYIKDVEDYKMIEKNELKDSEKELVIKNRIAKAKLKEVLTKEDSSCRLCGLEDEQLLRVSYIKPWDKSSDDEKLDMNNSILFCPNHGYLFDNYLMSFSNNGHIMISNALDDRARVLLNIFGDLSIEIKDEEKKYMDEHREEFRNRIDK